MSKSLYDPLIGIDRRSIFIKFNQSIKWERVRISWLHTKKLKEKAEIVFKDKIEISHSIWIIAHSIPKKSKLGSEYTNYISD